MSFGSFPLSVRSQLAETRPVRSVCCTPRSEGGGGMGVHRFRGPPPTTASSLSWGGRCRGAKKVCFRLLTTFWLKPSKISLTPPPIPLFLLVSPPGDNITEGCPVRQLGTASIAQSLDFPEAQTSGDAACARYVSPQDVPRAARLYTATSHDSTVSGCTGAPRLGREKCVVGLQQPGVFPHSNLDGLNIVDTL